MKEFLYEENVGNIEDKISIFRRNKCLVVINAELHTGEWPPRLGTKRTPTRSEALTKSLKKGMNRV